ncbi:HvfC/BufC N-terminal domain-containing protein [Kordiimonas aquimaris]|uniref:HvfC/BufC N-terminal domain-containing protein n=1 Tax=Kordiimonas aquimaris TaxID=707591 RepID=UPI0021D10833|nr:DNA-binding domain-containing protein [Kordiimonas aquimaris]
MERHEYHAFQDAFKNAVLTGEVETAFSASLLETSGVPVEQRLQIHFNNFRETLSNSLSGIFPALVAFVGDAFVKGALKEFCAAYPPEEASLSGYGERFSQFLSDHQVSEQLPYIADIVRLEWALHSLQQINELVYEIGDERDRYVVSNNVQFVKSTFPLMSLWSVATRQLPPEAVHLEQGGQTVVALLRDGEIALIGLDKAEAVLLEQVEDLGVINTESLNTEDKDILLMLQQKKILVKQL